MDHNLNAFYGVEKGNDTLDREIFKHSMPGSKSVKFQKVLKADTFSPQNSIRF